MLKIVFMGTPEFSVPILEALIEKYDVIGVVTQPDKMIGRKREIVYSPVKKCALKHNIPIFQPEKIRKEYEEIMALKPDIIVTAAYGQLVGMKLLNSPKYRSINVHGSLLPKYRGGAPIQQSIKDGCKSTGITIMYMEKDMDAGDILSQVEVEITDNDTSGTMFEKLSYAGRDLLIDTIDKLIDGKIMPIKQNHNEATFAYNITKDEELLDFTKDAKSVFDHVRAYNPSPIAYMTIGDENIKVYETKLTDYTHNTSCGKIFMKDKKVCITCGNNSVLELVTIQLSGKKAMLAKDAANGALRKYL